MIIVDYLLTRSEPIHIMIMIVYVINLIFRV